MQVPLKLNLDEVHQNWILLGMYIWFIYGKKEPGTNKFVKR